MATERERRAAREWTDDRAIRFLTELGYKVTYEITGVTFDARTDKRVETLCKPGEDHMAEANALVNGDRQAAYGSPLASYTAQAKVWSGMLADKLKTDLTAEDVVLLLAAMKLRRQAHKPKRDNVVDTHGYMLVLAHVEDGRRAQSIVPLTGIELPRSDDGRKV